MVLYFPSFENLSTTADFIRNSHMLIIIIVVHLPAFFFLRPPLKCVETQGKKQSQKTTATFEYWNWKRGNLREKKEEKKKKNKTKIFFNLIFGIILLLLVWWWLWVGSFFFLSWIAHPTKQSAELSKAKWKNKIWIMK